MSRVLHFYYAEFSCPSILINAGNVDYAEMRMHHLSLPARTGRVAFRAMVLNEVYSTRSHYEPSSYSNPHHTYRHSYKHVEASLFLRLTDFECKPVRFSRFV